MLLIGFLLLLFLCVYMETEILLSAKICEKSNFHRIKRKKGSKTVTQLLWVKYFISIVLNTYKIDDDILNNVSNNTLNLRIMKNFFILMKEISSFLK